MIRILTSLLLLVVLFSLCMLVADAQQQPQLQPPQQAPQDAQQPFTLKINADLVVETVTVKDKDGKAVEGLRKDDFTVTEDGVPQSISLFEFQRFEDAPSSATEVAIPKPTVEAVKPTQITPPAAGDARYQNRRLLVLFFDLSNISQTDALRSFLAADKFIRTQMTPADLVAMMAFHDGVVGVLQDFTDKREALYEVMQKLMYPDDNT